jgi:hypothetical protein
MAKGGSTQQRGRKVAQSPAEGRQNGNGQPDHDALQQAIEYEQDIANKAREIWLSAREQEASAEIGHVFPLLRLLLRKPIPPAYVQHVDAVTGKPYESTGVKSVQVQMDRLDNVLGPENWGYERAFHDDGKLCEVVAWVGESRELALFVRDSFGGVDRASTRGNLFKGSFTNAAKPAFARLGPGWEVYVGAADFDPDTDESAAEQQAKTDAPLHKDPNRPLSEAAVDKLRKAVAEKALTDEDVQMKLRSFGVSAIEGLTAEQGVGFWEWVNGADAKEPANG